MSSRGCLLYIPGYIYGSELTMQISDFHAAQYYYGSLREYVLKLAIISRIDCEICRKDYNTSTAFKIDLCFYVYRIVFLP